MLDDAAYNGDAAATAGSVSFASPNLTWTGNLAPGAAATITYTVTVHNPDTGDGILASTVTSAAAGNNCPAGSTDPRCATTVDVAALTIINTASVGTTTPGAVGGLHDHDHQHRAGRLRRRHRHRPAERRPGRRHLQLRRHRDRRIGRLHEPRA